MSRHRQHPDAAESGERVHVPTRLLVTATITTISGLIGVLLSLGKLGTQIAGTLAFGISMMSFLFTLADRFVLSNQALAARSAPPFSLSRRTVLLLALAASVLIGSLGTVGYYKLLRRPDIHFANRISVEHNQGLTGLSATSCGLRRVTAGWRARPGAGL
jgi:hypothetical protein